MHSSCGRSASSFGMLCIPHADCQPPHSECFAFLMRAVRDASRLARPMDMIEIRLKCKHFIRNFDHVHGVLNSYIIEKKQHKVNFFVETERLSDYNVFITSNHNIKEGG